MVAHEPCRDGGHARVRSVHASHELVVGERFIDEATPRRIDRKQTGLGPVERQMREGPAPAIEPPGLGDRCPERRRGVILLDRGAERARDPRAITGGARERDGVRERGPDTVVQPIDAAAKSAGRQHDPAAHIHTAGLAFD